MKTSAKKNLTKAIKRIKGSQTAVEEKAMLNGKS
jgi:hypothetical protein